MAMPTNVGGRISNTFGSYRATPAAALYVGGFSPRISCFNWSSIGAISESVKLRIRDNSIRLRLERSEVEALRNHGQVMARTGFPGGQSFAYAVESSPANTAPGAHFSENVVTVRIPEATVRTWATSEQISIDSEQLLDDGATLRILVEKDFACLAPRDEEDESDMFPNPQSG